MAKYHEKAVIKDVHRAAKLPRLATDSGSTKQSMQSAYVAESLQVMSTEQICTLLAEHVQDQFDMESPQYDLVEEAVRRLREVAKTCSTCSTCKHWKPAHNTWDSASKFRTCVQPAFIYGYAAVPKDVPDNGALIENDEGWGIITNPLFGCINWTKL